MLKEDVRELKSNVSEVKRLIAYMNRKINAIEPLQEAKESNEKAGMEEHERSEKKKKETEVVVEENKSRVKDIKKRQQKFKCEKCNYETTKKITLKKHINTIRNIIVWQGGDLVPKYGGARLVTCSRDIGI